MQITYKSKVKWLNGRNMGIGGSEASAVVGLNPYKTNVELYEEKIGKRKPEKLDDKPYIKYGHDAEKPLVELFALDYPQYEANYNDDYRVNYCDEYPFLFCTRDCDLVDKETGKKGALEVKTTEILNSMHKEKWNAQVPQNYYCQVLQYFITDNELDFVWLKAQIKSDFGGGDIKLTTKHYFFTRVECKDDIEWLREKEIIFWLNNVQKKVEPNQVLPQI